MKNKLRKKRSSCMTEFKNFINKGNVVDMAVGVIIGGAFSKIVSSFVNDIISPFIGLITGQVSLAELKWIIKPEITDPDTFEVLKEAVTVNYGQLLQYIIDFLIIAFCVFIFVKIISSARAKMEKKILEEKKAKGLIEEEAPKAPTTKKCPYCFTEIHIEATRCPNCTSELK